MFTVEERAQVRERVLALTQADARVTADALMRSLDEPELRRALAAATACYIAELEAWDPALCARLKPPRELGGEW